MCAVHASNSSNRARASHAPLDPLKRYLSEIQRYPLLSREQEQTLARRYRLEGCAAAAEELVTSNLRLVAKLAFQYSSAHISALDLIQEGNVGLIKAVERFEPAREVRFASYAKWWIRAYILKALMDNFRLVKIGAGQDQRRLFYNLRKTRDHLMRDGIEPTAERIAKALDVSVRSVHDMQIAFDHSDVSLDAPQGEDQGVTLGDRLAGDGPDPLDLFEREETMAFFRDRLAAFRDRLTGREAEIWDLRLSKENPLTLRELGERLGVSRERVRQLEARLIKKLARVLGSEARRHDVSMLNFPLFH